MISDGIWAQFKWELWKLLRRKRTYLGFAAYLVLEIALVVLLQRDDVASVLRKQVRQAGFLFESNYSAVTVAHFIVGWTLSIVGSLYLALVGGDIVAREVEEGSMRMLLCQPVSRRRVLGIKLVVCIVYSLGLTFFVSLSSLAVARVAVGPGRLFVYNLKEQVVRSLPWEEGLRIYLLHATPLLAVSMTTVTLVAFAFSCLKVKPVTATAATLSIFMIDEMLRGIPFFENVRHFFLTDRMATWIRVYLENPPWGRLARDYVELLVVDAVVVGFAFWVFGRRDFKP